MENKDQPAYPTLMHSKNAGTQWWDTINGLTKREYFAGLAMQAFAQAAYREEMVLTFDQMAGDSVKMAAALLKALETKTE